MNTKNSMIREWHRQYTAAIRAVKIVPACNHPGFDASVGFDTLDQGLRFCRALMTSPETFGMEEREAAASHDICLYRAGRLLAVVRHGPGGVLETMVFAPDVGTN